MKAVISAAVGLPIWLATVCAPAQGTFQNLDFENGTFIPVPAAPIYYVQFNAAMPGWSGYLGTNNMDRLFYNAQPLDNAGISIWGPDQPQPGLFHGHYYLIIHSFLFLLIPRFGYPGSL